jgi:hypothetical protein
VGVVNKERRGLISKEIIIQRMKLKILQFMKKVRVKTRSISQARVNRNKSMQLLRQPKLLPNYLNLILIREKRRLSANRLLNQ